MHDFFLKKRDLLDAHMTKIEQSEYVLKQLSEWAFRPKGMFWFIGNAGSGKTYAAAAISNYLTEQKKHHRFFDERSFISKLHAIIQQGFNPEFEIERLCESEIIFYDDLGANRKRTDWNHDQIYSFLDNRYTSNLPTFITTNMFLDEMKQIFHERLISRIMDRRNVIIELKGEDRRINGLPSEQLEYAG